MLWLLPGSPTVTVEGRIRVKVDLSRVEVRVRLCTPLL
ncbi:hypothetical protein XHC_1404 [Xanthomonas hortorum pv. carotae str. M081]|nr:hypothetical protein XHC_1404 [Xanthomonas hortorum pv. carotae str. M081]